MHGPPHVSMVLGRPVATWMAGWGVARCASGVHRGLSSPSGSHSHGRHHHPASSPSITLSTPSPSTSSPTPPPHPAPPARQGVVMAASVPPASPSPFGDRLLHPSHARAHAMEDEDVNVTGLMTAITAGVAADGAWRGEDGGSAALTQLIGLTSTGRIRDCDLPPAVFAGATELIQRLASRDDVEAMPLSTLRSLYGVATAVVSVPEAGARDALAAMEAVVAEPQWARDVVACMIRCSSAMVHAQERVVDSMGGVTTTTTRDEAQPTSGSISALRSGGGAATSVAATSSKPMATPLLSAPPGKREPSFSEMAHLKAWAFWALCRFPALVQPFLQLVTTLFTRYGQAPNREMAGTVRVLLQLLLPMLRAAQPATAGSAMMPAGVAAAVRSGSGALFSCLLPLHQVPGNMSETAAVLSLFHEPLVQVLFHLAAHPHPITTPAVAGVDATHGGGGGGAMDAVTGRWLSIAGAIQAAWLEVAAGASFKGITLLHELTQALQTATVPSVADDVVDAAATATLRRKMLFATLPAVVDAVSSDNSRLAQMALSLFKLDSVVEAMMPASTAATGVATGSAPAVPSHLTAMMRAMYRGGVVHWNSTANKLTHAAVKRLMERNAAVVEAAFAAVCGSGDGGGEGVVPHPPPPPPASVPGGKAGEDGDVAMLLPSPPNADGVAVDGVGAKPPPRMPIRAHPAGGSGGGDGGGTRHHPPLATTGIAPWAHVTGGGGIMDASAVGRVAGASKYSATNPPPVTITGVAPWAVKSVAATGAAPPHHAPMPAGAGVKPSASIITAPSPGTAGGSAGADTGNEAAPESPLTRWLRRLLPAIAPATSALGDALAVVEPVDVLAPVPKLLPSLAFHDLVFGHELGSGTFSTVRYAKRIHRGAPASTWPEYAVKVVSTSTMAALGYAASVRREMAVLSMLTHPNICRLVSAFRWRDGAYLVLEFGGKGDLHTLLTGLGSLTEETARFLAGEMLAAMHHVHSKGFAYGDCKPENVLLVEAGEGGGTHIKLADFGACRPITAAGAATVADARHILKNLRDGDWRAAAGLTTAVGPAHPDSRGGPALEAGEGDHGAGEAGEGVDDDEGGEEEEGRVEGTEEYLAPELATGKAWPSRATDAYAFGITLFQLLTGHLPEPGALWPAMPGAAAGGGRERHVQFRAGSGGEVGDVFPAHVSPAARDLIRACTHPDPTQRLGGGDRGLEEVMEHPWFAPITAGAPTAPAVIMALYTRAGPHVAAGPVAPSTDPAWSRRHNSTIWAPLPRNYVLDGSGPAGGGGAGRPSGGVYTPHDLVRADPSGMSNLPAYMCAAVSPPSPADGDAEVGMGDD